MSFITYLRESKAELKNIRWPSRETAFTYTALVVVISLVIAAYLGGLDYLFSQTIEWLILKF